MSCIPCPYTTVYHVSLDTKFAPTVCKINFCENFVPLARQRCVESPHPTSCASKKFVQISRADSICPYRAPFHYSLLLITLSVSETTPQSRFTPSQLPYRGSLNRFCDKTQFINHKTDRSRYAAVGYCFTAPVYVPGTFLIPYCLYSCRLRVRLRSRPPLRWSAGALPLCGSRPQ